METGKAAALAARLWRHRVMALCAYHRSSDEWPSFTGRESRRDAAADRHGSAAVDAVADHPLRLARARRCAPGSDIDVLVVLSDPGLVTRQTVIDMRLAIGDVPVDYDLLVTSSQDFEWRRDYVGTIEYPAAHEGVEVYAA